jgi:hypothetical protein
MLTNPEPEQSTKLRNDFIMAENSMIDNRKVPGTGSKHGPGIIDHS